MLANQPSFTMRNVCSLFLIFCLFPLSVLASDPPTPQVNIESKFVEVRNDFEKEIGFEWGMGPVVSHMTGGTGSGNVVGLTAFAGVDALIHPLISVFGHAKFTQFGEKVESPYWQSKFKIGSFVVDGGVKIHLTPTPSRVVDPFVIVGVDFGVNAFGHQTYKNGDQKDGEFLKLDKIPEFDNRVFAGIRGGAGVTIRTDVMDLTAQVVVIGGLTKGIKEDTERSVPLLFEIPIIGRLFFDRNKQKDRPQLIHFITPHIIDGEE